MEARLKTVIQSVFQVFSVQISDAACSALVQFIKFGVVGVSNTVVSYAINVAVLFALRDANWTYDYVVGNVVSFALSVLWSFYWNNKYVFTKKEGENRNLGKTLLKTYLSYGFTGIILNNILSWLWITGFGISKFIAPLLNLVVNVPLNFLLNKLWAFQQ